MKSITKTVAVIMAAAAFTACDKSPVAQVQQNDPQELALAADSVIVGVYQTSLPLSATVRDANGTVQLGFSLQYISRDPSVANVNANGTISAVAVGSTYVVASVSDRPALRDSVRVRVHADSCTGARPDFGGLATQADRDLFSYDVNAPLNFQKTVESVSTVTGVEVSNISFSSPDGGLVIGKMWNPTTRPGLRPGIILMHGLPGDENSLANLARQYAEYGAVAMTIGAPWNRRGAPPYLTLTAQDRVEQIQIVKDLQRAVDVLRSLPNVDADRIAFEGGSWGGATGALFVGIERRLKTAVLVVGHSGQVSLATGPKGYLMGTGLSCAARVAWIRAMAPIEPIRYVGNANIPVLMQNGTLDDLVPVANAEELHVAAQQPKEVRWYQAGHSLNPDARADKIKWLYDKIGLNAN